MKKASALPSEKKSPTDLHAGHRQRMFQKLKRGGLCDHELLETLLFFAIPRRNTNDIAHRLLFQFGTLSGVFNATADELATVEGIGENSAAFLQCVGAIMQSCKTSLTRDIPAYYDSKSFLAYAKNTYSSMKEEVLDIYFIQDDARIFLHRRFLGDADSVSLTMKWLQKLLVECAPTGMVMVHNHPSGCAQPSDNDRVAAEQCQALCMSADVLLCDFCVCAKEGVYSYYQTGDITQIARALMKHNARTTPLVKGAELE